MENLSAIVVVVSVCLLGLLLWRQRRAERDRERVGKLVTRFMRDALKEIPHEDHALIAGPVTMETKWVSERSYSVSLQDGRRLSISYFKYTQSWKVYLERRAGQTEGAYQCTFPRDHFVSMGLLSFLNSYKSGREAVLA